MNQKTGRPGFVEDIVLDIARKNHGVFTVDECKVAGIEPSALRKFVQRNKSLFQIHHRSRGVYCLYNDPEDAIDHSYTMMVSELKENGTDSFLFGDSVLCFHELAYALPRHDIIAVSKRRRIDKPPVRTVFYPSPNPDEVEVRNGVRMQKIEYALLSTLETPKRYLFEGARQALDRGLISHSKFLSLEKKLA